MTPPYAIYDQSFEITEVVSAVQLDESRIANQVTDCFVHVTDKVAEGINDQLRQRKKINLRDLHTLTK